MNRNVRVIRLVRNDSFKTIASLDDEQKAYSRGKIAYVQLLNLVHRFRNEIGQKTIPPT